MSDAESLVRDVVEWMDEPHERDASNMSHIVDDSDLLRARNRLVDALALMEKDRAFIEAALPALERLIPRKERGPWRHGYGCPAEIDGTDNAPCTCGAWAQIDKDQALVREYRARRAARSEATGE